jgi:cytoplasmic iron level regulating protein YaaA (DUF328/UPF0246 family)
MKRLLLLSCSSRKLKAENTTAIQLYTGVFFQVLKKALLVPEIQTTTDILIISAKYGLLAPESSVEFYEQRLDKRTKEILKPAVATGLTSKLASSTYKDIFVNLGRDYLELISGVPELAKATYAGGGIGKRCQQLKQWLYLPHST